MTRAADASSDRAGERGQRARGGRAERSQAHRVAVTAGIVTLVAAGAALVALHAQIPLLLFAGVLAAVLLDGIAAPLHRRLGVSRRALVCAVAVLVVALLAGAAWLWGPKIVEQTGAFVQQLPAALNQIDRFLERSGWVDVSRTPSEEWTVERITSALGTVWKPIAGIFTTAFAAFSGAVVVATLGFFLALQPCLYVGGIAHVIPRRARERYFALLNVMARALRWWLAGQFASMAFVGVLTVIGLMLLGVSNAFLLGLIAGTLSFIPYLGPILGAAPAALVGLAHSPQQALHVVLLFLGIQIVESNLITPLIQVRAVSLPPATLIAAQLTLGVLFGFLGVLVATPLTVVTIVAIQTLWVRDALDDDAGVLGDQHGDPSDENGDRAPPTCELEVHSEQ